MARPRIFVTRALPGESLAPLRAAGDVHVLPDDGAPPREALLAGIAGADGLLCFPGDPIDAEAIAAGARLRAIATVSVGFEHIDLAAARARGIVVSHTPGVLTNATAELTFALLLATARRVIDGNALARSGGWRGWTPGLLLGKELAGATLAVIGAGRIGRAVGRRAEAFDMRVVYVGRGEPLDRALAEADFVTLHVPLTPATRHLIGARELGLMKPDAVLVNTARGAVVDEAALVRALEERRIGAAGLDVYEREPAIPEALRRLSNVVLLPHLGSATHATRARMAAAATADLVAALRGERPRFPVTGSA